MTNLIGGDPNLHLIRIDARALFMRHAAMLLLSNANEPAADDVPVFYPRLTAGDQFSTTTMGHASPTKRIILEGMSMTANRPAVRPARPFFSSGPCAKRPGWSPERLNGALLGRS